MSILTQRFASRYYRGVRVSMNYTSRFLICICSFAALSLSACKEMGAKKLTSSSVDEKVDEKKDDATHGGAAAQGGARNLASTPQVASMSKACGRSKGTPFHDNQNFQGAGCATAFGLNTSGTGPDPIDNGKGAWGDNTKNRNIVGVSLPIPVINAYQAAHGSAHNICVEIFNPTNGKTIMAPIVDKGPATWTGNALDLTYKANQMLGGDGKDFMTYKIISGRQCSKSG